MIQYNNKLLLISVFECFGIKLVIFDLDEPQIVLYFRDCLINIVEYLSRVTTYLPVSLIRNMDSELKAEFYFTVTCSIQKTSLFSLFD